MVKNKFTISVKIKSNTFEVAGAGLDETQAATQNIPYEVSKLEFKDVPREMAAYDTRVFIKLTATLKQIN